MRIENDWSRQRKWRWRLLEVKALDVTAPPNLPIYVATSAVGAAKLHVRKLISSLENRFHLNTVRASTNTKLRNCLAKLEMGEQKAPSHRPMCAFGDLNSN